VFATALGEVIDAVPAGVPTCLPAGGQEQEQEHGQGHGLQQGQEQGQEQGHEQCQEQGQDVTQERGQEQGEEQDPAKGQEQGQEQGQGQRRRQEQGPSQAPWRGLEQERADLEAQLPLGQACAAEGAAQCRSSHRGRAQARSRKQRGRVQHSGQAEGSLVAHEVAGYLRELQAQLHRLLVKLFLVGFVQNAVQTKLQITFLSLDFNQKGTCDPLFCIGIVLNLAGYFMSLLDVFDIVKLRVEYKKKLITSLLKGTKPRFEQAETIEVLRTRVAFCFFVGFFFTIAYLAFYVYLWFNFTMLFLCPSHIWNVNVQHPSEGCVQPVQ